MKDFDRWNEQKKMLDESSGIFFQEKDIFYAKIGANVGHEHCGKGTLFLRPVLIIKKFTTKTALVIPLTKAKNKKFSFSFSFKKKKRQGTLLIEQMRLIDSRRFLYKIDTIANEDFAQLKKSLRKILKL